MPVKGYDSVNLPSGLYKNVKALVKSRNVGYRSVTEFVAEAVRKRLEEINKIPPRIPLNLGEELEKQ